MDGKKIRILRSILGRAPSALLAVALCSLVSVTASAAVVELSAMLAYSSSDFADGYKSVQRRYSGSIDFKFTSVSALEFEYLDSTTNISYPTTLGGLLGAATPEEISYRDNVYSFNWVQNLVSSKWIIQPYVVVGGGRMTRRITDSLPVLGFQQVTTNNVLTGTGGVGIRIFLTKTMAIKAESKTYVPNFQFSKWKENQMQSIGLSWMF